MLYKDLNLKELREKCDIDFAHYTYKKYQCSCCYGPKDMAKKYWKNGKIKEDNFTYILFKHARDCGGYVKPEDTINDVEYIKWVLTPEELIEVCKKLQTQMPEYTIFVPKEPANTIIAIKSGAKVESNIVNYISNNYTTIPSITTNQTT